MLSANTFGLKLTKSLSQIVSVNVKETFGGGYTVIWEVVSVSPQNETAVKVTSYIPG